VQDYGFELDVETLQYRKAGRRHHTHQQVCCNTTGNESDISFIFLIILNVRASNDLCIKTGFSLKRNKEKTQN
jgi:hypothetical protein